MLSSFSDISYSNNVFLSGGVADTAEMCFVDIVQMFTSPTNPKENMIWEAIWTDFPTDGVRTMQLWAVKRQHGDVLPCENRTWNLKSHIVNFPIGLLRDSIINNIFCIIFDNNLTIPSIQVTSEV